MTEPLIQSYLNLTTTTDTDRSPSYLNGFGVVVLGGIVECCRPIGVCACMIGFSIQQHAGYLSVA